MWLSMMGIGAACAPDRDGRAATAAVAAARERKSLRE
jgi:hypothetical protein